MKKIGLCPCTSNKKYRDCCQKYHQGALPETALALMRSRYCAYALGIVDYIIQTTHPTNPSYTLDIKRWKEEIQQFTLHTLFKGLQIIEFNEGPEVSFVTFKALLEQQGKDVSFTERSRFFKIQGKWLYVDGEFII